MTFISAARARLLVAQDGGSICRYDERRNELGRKALTTQPTIFCCCANYHISLTPGLSSAEQNKSQERKSYLSGRRHENILYYLPALTARIYPFNGLPLPYGNVEVKIDFDTDIMAEREDNKAKIISRTLIEELKSFLLKQSFDELLLISLK